MKVLVTGAAGKLGSAVCRAMVERGHEVRATDHQYRRDLPVPLTLADLRDDLVAYRLLEGCDAVAHLANHPNLFAGPSPQNILAENTAMNANVFRASVDLGIRRIAFASSIQAMLRVPDGTRAGVPYPIPFLPLDGTAPANPGSNFYGLSKEFGERMLQEFALAEPKSAFTALRFPALMSEHWLPRYSGGGKPVPRARVPFGELFSYLMLSDAGEVVVSVLEREAPGYHQYFPAQTLEVRGYSAPRLIREFYGHVPLQRPLDEIETLVDISLLRDAVGWVPKHRSSIEFED
jgi:nucleoside-diphosphate-sugar epimerase